MARRPFDEWITELRESVIQGDYGYEDGEFTVFPDQWRPLWREGLSPQQAFRRALDAFADERATEDLARRENWERIQREDAKAVAAYASAKSERP